MLPHGGLRDEIIEMDPGLLSCSNIVKFENYPSGDAPGTNYDAVIDALGASFGERFFGQVTEHAGQYDVVIGDPVGPLALEPGVANQNLSIAYYYGTHSNVLSGLGPVGFPSLAALGEGAVAVLFHTDQSAVGFETIGGNEGNVFVDFFRRDGSHIDTYTLTTVCCESYAFKRDGDVPDIGGIVLYSDDPGGLGFDNFCVGGAGAGGNAPVCDAAGNYWGYANNPIEFDGSDSFDPDGGTIVSWDWDFGDGTSGSGELTEHTYTDDGVYVVTLCVTDDTGFTMCCQTYVMVTCSPVERTTWGGIKGIYK